MQEKDIAEKEFVSHNDVFADIVNGFLFHGRQVVDPDDLGPASCRGYYIEKGKLHETVRDVARTVEKSGLVVSLVGIENQSASDRYMPIRVGCYDFSSYRSQLGRKPPQRVCPAVTLVPYYGMTRWPYPTRLSELLDVPEAPERRIQAERERLGQARGGHDEAALPADGGQAVRGSGKRAFAMDCRWRRREHVRGAGQDREQGHPEGT